MYKGYKPRGKRRSGVVIGPAVQESTYLRCKPPRAADREIFIDGETLTQPKVISIR